MLLLATMTARAGDDAMTYTPWKGAELKAGTEDSAFTIEWNHTWKLADPDARKEGKPAEQNDQQEAKSGEPPGRKTNGRFDLALSGSQDENVGELFQGLTPASGLSLELFLGWDAMEKTLSDRLQLALDRHTPTAWVQDHYEDAEGNLVRPSPDEVKALIASGVFLDPESQLRKSFEVECQGKVPDDYTTITEAQVRLRDEQWTIAAANRDEGKNAHEAAVKATAAARKAEGFAVANLDAVAKLAAASPPPADIEQRVEDARAAVASTKAATAAAIAAESAALEKRVTTQLALERAQRSREEYTCGLVKGALSGESGIELWRSSDLRSYQRTGVAPATVDPTLKTTFGFEFEAEYTSVKAYTREAGTISDDPDTFSDFEAAAGLRLEQNSRNWGVQLTSLFGVAQGVSTDETELCTLLDASTASPGVGEQSRTAESCATAKLLKVDDAGDSTAPSISGTGEAQIRARMLLRPVGRTKDVDAVPGLELKAKLDDLLEDDPSFAVTAGAFLVRTEDEKPLRTGLFFEQAVKLSGEVAPVRGYVVIGASL